MSYYHFQHQPRPRRRRDVAVAKRPPSIDPVAYAWRELHKIALPKSLEHGYWSIATRS